jgi:hypothetical protein
MTTDAFAGGVGPACDIESAGDVASAVRRFLGT